MYIPFPLSSAFTVMSPFTVPVFPMISIPAELFFTFKTAVFNTFNVLFFKADIWIYPVSCLVSKVIIYYSIIFPYKRLPVETSKFPLFRFIILLSPTKAVPSCPVFISPLFATILFLAYIPAEELFTVLLRFLYFRICYIGIFGIYSKTSVSQCYCSRVCLFLYLLHYYCKYCIFLYFLQQLILIVPLFSIRDIPFP